MVYFSRSFVFEIASISIAVSLIPCTFTFLLAPIVPIIRLYQFIAFSAAPK